MDNKPFAYKETHRLPLNEFLLFYAYMLLVFGLANLLPVMPETYFLFLFFGVIGIGILVIRFTYNIVVNKNTMELSIKIPFRVMLIRLKIAEIKTIDTIKSENLANHRRTIRKAYRMYTFKKSKGLKLTMLSGKIFIISGVDSDGIINHINSYTESRL